ncbi:tyrosine-type recombinase/integrase [Methanonatronarchaeum sp. AMET-Sl]|uniref:tyrosine-type recombinase/integrase n=1 Tax=Methanonatronarchaeum sp. AMET-Sl TaxID=3037654 RepID=UPI00244E0B35|nr:tyrosine-type recombinase/integrase [Methanonatronarchaeum sp. AMET-Sl]WGI17763.1 tyrosine-type recombinase/integrase [Methanonatronarchaeum sp. AMET-Sl]
MKSFYKWINGGEYPSKVKWINTTQKGKDKSKLPKDLLTEEDILKLLRKCTHVRDKAFISILWETGARIGELIDLEVGDFEDHHHGFKINLNGKTGERRLLLISSVPHLTTWLNSHPNRNDKDAPLWVNIGNSHNGQKCSYMALSKILKKTAKEAGVDKPVNPHQFRHSRTTYLANEFTEAQL